MKEVAPKIFKTKNINNAIDQFAMENNILQDVCDFTLLSLDNYVKNSTTNEQELIEKDSMNEYLNKERILNEHLNIHQVYKIKIFQQQSCKIKLKYEIDFGDYSSHPKILLHPKSSIPYKMYPPKELLKILFKELNKIKAYHNILINIFDLEMKQKLKSFIKYLYAGKFQKRIKLPLFNGIEPEMTRKPKLIYWYKEKDTHSAVVEVDPDELLIEFKKPIFGKNGFNAFGEEIDSTSLLTHSDSDIEIDAESIIIKENDNAKLYKSKKKGFVHFENNILSVNNTIKVSKISRNNIALASEEENNIEVLVSQNDTNKDSVGEGVSLVSETINVNGFVGAGSKLEAIYLNIDGATHQDSVQFAKHAKINRHKGKLRCHEAKIHLLEGGEVHATNLFIETCMGGSVYAQNVTIGHVKNNLKVYASNSIKIRLISGEDNSLMINYKKIQILDVKIKYILNDIEDLKYYLEEAERHNKKEVPTITQKIKALQDEIKTIKESYKTATISIEKPLRGLNKIIFTIDEENEIVYKTEAKEYSPFFLEIQDNKITLEPVKVSLTLEN